MADFASYRSYWYFAQSVRRKARYVFQDEVNTFLQTVLATSEARKAIFSCGRRLWRAQEGDHWENISFDGDEDEIRGPLPAARMKPRVDYAREGRVNPKGIPALYLATDRDTAMAEVRPWLGSSISVGQFKTLKELLLINCSVEYAFNIKHCYVEEPAPDKREQAVWADIDRAFSSPVTLDDSSLDYVPTQILAEAFRGHGYDGIVYKSLLGGGFNVALFNLSAADLVSCFLYEARSISFQFEEAANPYFVGKT